MRILGVTVLGLLELTACRREREDARPSVNAERASPFDHRPRLRVAPPVALDESRECVAPADELRQERG